MHTASDLRLVLSTPLDNDCHSAWYRSLHISYMFCTCFVRCFACLAPLRLIFYRIGWTSTWCCDGRLAKPSQSAGPLAGHVRAKRHSKSILSNSRAPASAAGPSLIVPPDCLSCYILPIFFQSKFSIKFSSNFDAILPPTWPPKSSQNPSKIDFKSLLKV